MPMTIGPANDHRTLCEYPHDTHVVVNSVGDCVKELIAAGHQLQLSETALVHRTYGRGYPWDSGPYTHSYHFFGTDGREIANFIPGMASVVPAMTIFDIPRVWGRQIIAEHDKENIAHYISAWKPEPVVQG